MSDPIDLLYVGFDFKESSYILIPESFYKRPFNRHFASIRNSRILKSDSKIPRWWNRCSIAVVWIPRLWANDALFSQPSNKSRESLLSKSMCCSLRWIGYTDSRDQMRQDDLSERCLQICGLGARSICLSQCWQSIPRTTHLRPVRLYVPSRFHLIKQL